MTLTELRGACRKVLPSKAAEAVALAISRFRVTGVRVEFTPKDHPTHPGLPTLDDRARERWKVTGKALRAAAASLAAIQPDDPLVETLRRRAVAIDAEATARRRHSGRRHDVEAIALTLQVATICAQHAVLFTDTNTGLTPGAKILSAAFEFHGRGLAASSLRRYLRLGQSALTAKTCQ